MWSRERIGAWIESNSIQRFIITLIVINAVTLGLRPPSHSWRGMGTCSTGSTA